nr:TetR-like C-terminal domain-containing protein [uncultured Acetatifactor sp.]
MIDCHAPRSFLRVTPAVLFCADRHKTPSARPHIPHSLWYISAPYPSSWIERISVPKDFLTNHISSSFVDMVQWWLKGGRKQSPEQLTSYFEAVIRPIFTAT